MKHGRTFKIGEAFICAIINEDYTGLSKEDIQKLEEFEKQNNTKHLVIGESLGFSKCQVSKLYDNCYEMTELVSEGVK